MRQTWLLLPFLFNVIACLDLRSMALGNATVVWDQNSARFLCYPSPTSSQLPADHQDFMNSTGGTLVFQPAETDARHAARVICRQLGFSHLERVYRVAFKISTKTKRNLISAAASPPPLPPLLSTNRASGGPGSATKTGIPTILKWRAECQGYEPILTHCPNMEVLDDQAAGANHTCDHLLGLQCGKCSETMRVSDHETVHISSPEYPDYSDAAVCHWRLAVSPPLRHAHFALNFSSFRLPSPDDRGLCTRSVLEVDEVPDDKRDFVSKSVKSMCGSAVPEPFVVTARAIVLRFSSGIFYPRPHNGVGGFKLTVQTRPAEILPPPPRTLKVGEILTIVLGCILVLTICCFVYYIMKRHRLERRWILQREVMQQRLASHHEANLTSMLTGLELVRQTGLARPLGGAGGSSRTRLPLPTEKKEAPDAPGGQYQPYRPAPPPTLPPTPYGRQANAVGNEDEMPLYMELEQLKMKDSGVCFLEQSACHSSSAGDTPRGGRPSTNITVSDSCSCAHSACQACVSPRQGTAPCHASRKPPRQASTNLLNPAVNTASPTYICANALDGSVTSADAGESRASGSPSGDSKCHRPRGLSQSSLLYPKLSLSPAEARTPASLSSSWSRRRCHRASHAENHSSGLLSPARSLVVMSHGKGAGEEASRGMRSQISSGSITAFAKGDPHPRPQAFVEDASRRPHEPKAVEENHSRAGSQSCEERERAQSSLESVFFSGDPDRRPWRRLVPCSDHALTPEGLHHSAHSRPASRAQLSKSCGDVSPPADATLPWASLDVRRSDPSLPREALDARICPALRRVSEMFVGSVPFMTAPGEESSPPPRPATDAEGGKGVVWTPHAALRSCFVSSAHGYTPFKYNRFDGGGADWAPGASVAEVSLFGGRREVLDGEREKGLY